SPGFARLPSAGPEDPEGDPPLGARDSGPPDDSPAPRRFAAAEPARSPWPGGPEVSVEKWTVRLHRKRSNQAAERNMLWLEGVFQQKPESRAPRGGSPKSSPDLALGRGLDAWVRNLSPVHRRRRMVLTSTPLIREYDL